MKPLKEVCPDPKKVLDLEPSQLGHHVLHCLTNANDSKIKRGGIAQFLASHYPKDFQHDIAHAVEEALGWLAAQCLMGASPYDQDMVFVTRAGLKYAENHEHPADISVS
jgi:hypothetical protein